MTDLIATSFGVTLRGAPTNLGGWCPTQWEGVNEDGRRVYMRYRWGVLDVSVDGVHVWSKTIGDDLDGILTDEEMMQHITAPDAGGGE